MSLPLAYGQVLVRLHGGDREAADAVLDVLEDCFPHHAGRGRSLAGNVWEAPPSLTAEHTWAVAGPGAGRTGVPPPPGPPTTTAQTFDVQSAPVRQVRPVTLAGEITADLLGSPGDVDRLVRVLTGLLQVQRGARRDQGPQLELRLRLGPAVEPPDRAPDRP
jgi:hypothetical protein